MRKLYVFFLVFIFLFLTSLVHRKQFYKQGTDRGEGVSLTYQKADLIYCKEREFCPEPESDPHPSVCLFLFEKIPINSSRIGLIQTVPGIGEKLATRISNYRKHKGPYEKPEDLLHVKGIGPKKLQSIKNYFSFKERADHHD